MTITLTPEQQKLIDEAVHSGAYRDAGQVIYRALEVLTAEDKSLQEHRQEIHAKIGRGLEQLDHGEGFSGEEARARLQKRKAAWREANSQTTP